jgi:hypothetical protein
MNPEDLSELRAPGIVGAIKFFLFYGSRRRILEKRREWFATWVKAGRFVVGSDLAEERYFIVLSEASPKVYRYELETRRASVAAESIAAWLAEVQSTQTHTESET